MFGKKPEENQRAAGGSNFSINSIEKGTVIIGDVQTTGNFRVDGNVKGTIKCKAKLVIGPSGMVEGEISCKNAELSGAFKGKIEIEENFILTSTADFSGECITNKISIESGASFNGSCLTNKSAIKELKPKDLSTEDNGEYRTAEKVGA